MSFEPIINIDSIKDNIVFQYSESQNLIDYIGVLLTPFDELEQVYADILNKRIFENTTTDTLNIWGTLVVQSRDAYDTTEFPFFGMKEADTPDPFGIFGFGDTGDLSVGGIFRSIEQPTTQLVPLTDQAYKNTIITKQHKNNYNGGTEALLDAIMGLYGFETPGLVEVRDNFDDPSDPFVEIEFYIELTNAQKSYLTTLDLLPRPGGIRYEYIFSSGIDNIITLDGLTVTTSDGLQILSRRA